MKLAVYGTLKRGHGNWGHYLNNEHVKFLGTALTEPKFKMFNGGFPIVEENGETSIHIEVFEVNNENVIKHINNLEGYYGENNPKNWYHTIEIDTPYGKANMFVMESHKHNRTEILKNGKWK